MPEYRLFGRGSTDRQYDSDGYQRDNELVTMAQTCKTPIQNAYIKSKLDAMWKREKAAQNTEFPVLGKAKMKTVAALCSGFSRHLLSYRMGTVHQPTPDWSGAGRRVNAATVPGSTAIRS